MKERLGHVYWIGGGSGAGKSTTARHLASRFGRDFRRLVFVRRGPQWGFQGRVSDPRRAMENLLARDAMFTSRLRAETSRLGLPVVTVGGTLTEEALVTRVAQRFQLA